MSYDTSITSGNSQSSCGSNNYDELFDLSEPPSCSPLNSPLPKRAHRSQLFLRKIIQSNDDSDSGFDFTSSLLFDSNNEEIFPTEFQYVSQNPVSTNSEKFESDKSQTTIHSINFSDEEMPLSGAIKNENDEDQTQETPTDIDDNMSDSIPSEFDQVLKLFSKIKTKYSDYSFVYALAANMCKDIYPKSSYISLKMALLLSIVSCDVQNDTRPISIMAITRDSASASTIMRLMGNFARRFIYISDDLKFNGKSTQTRSIEANSLLMARNGVCFIGDWLALKATSLNYLQNVVDSGRITANAPSNIEYALKCAIWMYWTCSAKKMNQNQKDFNIISKLFGIPVVIDDSPSKEVIDFLFEQCTSSRLVTENVGEVGEDDGIEEDMIRAYLNFVSKIPTEFDEDALAMLKYYFVVTRKVRPNILTQKSFDVLHRLSECHAKLCLHSEVLKIDVVFAIELFEQFVLESFAGQVMTKPIPNISPSSYQQVDDNMREFTLWLDGYLSNINEKVESFFHEDILE